MSFLSKLFKHISYFSDSEDPLHETEFVMDGWDDLSPDEQRNYLKSLLAGMGIAITLGAGYFLIDKLVGERLEKVTDKCFEYVKNNKEIQKKKTYEEVYDSLLLPSLDAYDDVEIEFKDEMKKGLVKIYQEGEQDIFKNAGGFFIPRGNFEDGKGEFIHFRKPNVFKEINPFVSSKNQLPDDVKLVQELAKHFVELNEANDKGKVYVKTCHVSMSEKD